MEIKQDNYFIEEDFAFKKPEYKSKMILGYLTIYHQKHFNWFRKLMYKLAFDIKIEDIRGDSNE